MAKYDKKIIIIPARLAASRLPGKPLAEIGGKPMIQLVWERAIAADMAPVYVATDDHAIANVITSAGGKAVMTKPDHPSGSDRIFEAIEIIDPDKTISQILNLQGDLPDLSPDIPHLLGNVLDRGGTDIATLVAPASQEDAARTQVVKAVVSWKDETFGKAIYFSRAAIPTGTDNLWHHIGVYGWQRSVLARFVSRSPSTLELAEKLEQLRALEMGMSISVGKIATAPGGVDTAEDLESARMRAAATQHDD
jgi:3-deoxy-manno-octulosonate cytidylyltransferase (CMP-KDO synthetase)